MPVSKSSAKAPSVNLQPTNVVVKEVSGSRRQSLLAGCFFALVVWFLLSALEAGRFVQQVYDNHSGVHSMTKDTRPRVPAAQFFLEAPVHNRAGEPPLFQCDAVDACPDVRWAMPIDSPPMAIAHMVMYRLFRLMHLVAEKFSIDYVLEGGGMLGAHRTGHMLPHDLDLDVIVLNGDFDKFVDHLLEHMPPGICVKTNGRSKAATLYPDGKVKDCASCYLSAEDAEYGAGLQVDLFRTFPAGEGTTDVYYWNENKAIPISYFKPTKLVPLLPYNFTTPAHPAGIFAKMIKKPYEFRIPNDPIGMLGHVIGGDLTRPSGSYTQLSLPIDPLTGCQRSEKEDEWHFNYMGASMAAQLKRCPCRDNKEELPLFSKRLYDRSELWRLYNIERAIGFSHLEHEAGTRYGHEPLVTRLSRVESRLEEVNKALEEIGNTVQKEVLKDKPTDEDRQLPPPRVRKK